MTSGPAERSGIDLAEAARQLELAVHDAAENVIRAALNGNDSPADE